MKPANRRAAAFTLIELLVVIAVIMLLAALALPVLEQATRSARAAQCVTQIKQLVTAFRTYANQHKGLLPNMYRYLQPNGALSNTPTWMQSAPRARDDEPRAGQLWPYYNDEELVLCPSDHHGNGVFSYSGAVFISHRSIEGPTNPTTALLVLGEHERHHIGPPRRPGDASSIEAGFGSIDRPSVRHGRRTPVGFFDGSAVLKEFPAGFIAYDVEIHPWGKNDYYHQP